MDLSRLIEQLKSDEGFTPHAFWDNEQFTYGYGCKAPYCDATITEEEATVLLETEAMEAVRDFETLYDDCRGFINDVRAEALTNMCFNLGRSKMLHFRRMNAAIRRNDWLEAAYQAQNSSWFYQVGNRAKRIVKELATGEKEV